MNKGKPTRPGRLSDSPRRVLIVDDHPMVRLGLAELIGRESDLAVCGEAGKASQAIQMLEEARPDVVLVDISLEDMSGLDLVHLIRQQDPSLRVLVCSMHSEELYAERALRAGASGYVCKSEGSQQVLEAIRTVLKGKVRLSEGASERVLASMADYGEVPTGPRVERLSNRELEIFELIGQGKTSRQIAEELHLSIKTVDAHRQKIKTKLNLQNASELVYRAVQWVLEER
jgi:DNA-binding NarL/FixJ family response regulator